MACSDVLVRAQDCALEKCFSEVSAATIFPFSTLFALLPTTLFILVSPIYVWHSRKEHVDVLPSYLLYWKCVGGNIPENNLTWLTPVLFKGCKRSSDMSRVYEFGPLVVHGPGKQNFYCSEGTRCDQRCACFYHCLHKALLCFTVIIFCCSLSSI